MQCPHGFVLQISHFITDFVRKILCSTSSNLSYQAPYPLHRIMGNLVEENNPKLRNFTPSLIKPWFCCLRGELVPSTLDSPHKFLLTIKLRAQFSAMFAVFLWRKVKEGVFAVGEVEKEIWCINSDSRLVYSIVVPVRKTNLLFFSDLKLAINNVCVKFLPYFESASIIKANAVYLCSIRMKRKLLKFY